MSWSRFVLPSLLAIGIAGAACGRTGKADTPSTHEALPKNERAGIWQATQGGIQTPLWSADTPLAKPDSGHRPRGNG